MQNTIHLLNKRLTLHQPEDGFKTAIDGVLLAAACPAKAEEHVLDLGCGVGTAGLCVLARTPEVLLTGIDIQADHIGLARANALENKMAEHSQFETACVTDYIRRDAGGKNRLFDHVTCNPPYNESGAHVRSPSPAKALAMGHDQTTLEDWITCANRNLKSGGSFTLVHQASQLDKILQALEGKFGAVEIIPLWPKTGIPAKRVIIRCLKDRKSPATLHAGITLHQENGDYTLEAEALLRGMKALIP